ncbi:MAG: YceI family protein [Pseudomonadota bacterium]|nr:YceI family protein [Pseudomonadota bacterium]
MSNSSWNFDTAHSSITFSIRHLVISKVHGRFTRWTGAFALDAEGTSPGTISAAIEVASIDTNEAQRDGHLRSPDFFDAERFPTMSFASTRIRRIDDSAVEITGQLTIRDVSREVTLAADFGGRVTDPWGNQRLGYSAKTTINRKDFGLGWNQVLEAGGVVVGEKVEIAIEVELVKASA